MNNKKIQIFHGDCLELIKELPDNHIDAVVTDPPYFLTDLKFDDKKLYIKWWDNELLRVVKHNGYLISFGSIKLLADIANIWPIRFSGIWLKQSPTMRTHNAKKPMNKFENYMVYAHPKHKIKELTYNKITYPAEPYKTIHRYRGYKRGSSDQIDRADPSGWTKDGYVSNNEGYRYYTDVITGNNKTGMKNSERTSHPTQKPVNVLEVLIQWTTNSGDIVLDMFMGSGSTGVACKNTDRQFIGYEIDKEYFDIADKRLNNNQLL